MRPRQRTCRPKSGRLTTWRVRQRALSAAPRSARSAAGVTRSGAAGPQPTCPAPMPSSSANGPPAGARGQLKHPLPCRPQDGRQIGGEWKESTRTRAPWQTDAASGLAAALAAHHQKDFEDKPGFAPGVEFVRPSSRAHATSADAPNSCAIWALQRARAKDSGGRWGGAQGGHRRWQTAPNHAVSQSPAARDATARIGGAGAGWRVAAPAAWKPARGGGGAAPRRVKRWLRGGS